MPLEDRANFFASKSPQLRVSLTLYPTEESVRSTPIIPGWMCSCFAVKDPFENRRAKASASDGAPILVDGQMELGTTQVVDFIFPLAGKDAVPLVEKSTRFYLWEGGYVGEADVLEIYKQLT